MPLRTLYVNRQGAMLGIRNESLVVRVMHDILDVVPMASLQSVVLFGNIQVSTQALHKLLAMGIDLVFLSQKGTWRGRLLGPKPRNIFLQLAQYEAVKNIEFRMRWGRTLIFLKILAERMMKEWWEGLDSVYLEEILLRVFELGIERVDVESLPISESWSTDLRERILGVKSIQELMGIEGVEAHRYFANWDQWLVKEGFECVQRSRRPAKNPVNALLNLGYMMMLAEVERVLIGDGFEPMLGLLHGIAYGRNSLALDILELFRTFPIERLVLQTFITNMLDHSHFERHSSGEVRLTDDGWGIWLRAYEQKMSQTRPYIQKISLILRSQLLTRGGVEL